MKKTMSIFLSIVMMLSLFSFGGVTAFANTQSTAPKLTLGASTNAYVDVNNRYYVAFEPSLTGYYEFACTVQSSDSSIFASITDFSGETLNTVVNDYTNPNLICGALLSADRTYYYVLESQKSSLSTGVTVRNHTHSYSTTLAYPAYVGGNTKVDGEAYSVCNFCPYAYTSANYYAPNSIKLKTSSFTYNGKAKSTTVTVYDRFGNAIPSNQYSVSFSGNKNPGYGTVYVNFFGNYTGSLSTKFTIKPKTQSISSLKSNSKKKFTVKWKKDTLATGYQIQYSTSSKFTKSATKTSTVTKKSITSKTVSSLKSKKKYYVRVRSYKTSNGKKIYGSYSKTKTIKIK